MSQRPDARVKIAIDDAGRIHFAYAVFQDERYNGRVYVSRSLDGGKSFAAPRPITDDTNEPALRGVGGRPER